MSSPLSAAGFGLTPLQNPSAGLMSVDWVKGQVIVDPQYQAKFIELLPTIKGIISGVRDVDPIMMTRPDPEALLNLLRLAGPITYLTFKQQQLIENKSHLTALATEPLHAQQAQAILVELSRLELIRDTSVSAIMLGLIRGISIVDGLLTLTYTPTTEKCLHRDALRNAMNACALELATILKNAFGLQNAKVDEILGVWKPTDMDAVLLASHGSAVTSNSQCATQVTLNGSRLVAAQSANA